jgi:hypothetical protein
MTPSADAPATARAKIIVAFCRGKPLPPLPNAPPPPALLPPHPPPPPALPPPAPPPPPTSDVAAADRLPPHVTTLPPVRIASECCPLSLAGVQGKRRPQRHRQKADAAPDAAQRVLEEAVARPARFKRRSHLDSWARLQMARCVCSTGRRRQEPGRLPSCSDVHDQIGLSALVTDSRVGLQEADAPLERPGALITVAACRSAAQPVTRSTRRRRGRCPQNQHHIA